MEESKSRYHLVLYALVFAALVYGFIRFWNFYHDDEMITLRYVRNFLEHGELNWNLGERVEGYTNFLHLVFTSVIVWLTKDYLFAPRIVNLLFYLGMICTAVWVFRKRLKETGRKNDWLLITFLAIVVTYPGVIIWIYGGLETVMYASLIFMAFACMIYKPWRPGTGVLTGLLFAMAAMTRPDGLLFLSLGGLYFLVRAVKEKNWAPFLSLGLTFLAVYGTYFLIRYNYYGQLLPNTFYAKTGFDSQKLKTGLRYASRFGSSLAFVILALGLMLVLNIARKSIRLSAWLLLAAIGAYSLYIITYGGDHMLGFRFFIPLVPLIGLLYTELAGTLPVRFWKWALGLALVNVLFVYGYNQQEFRNAVVTDPAAYKGSLVGNYLNSLPETKLIATNSAGAIPFFGSRHRYIDMLGLCDTVIAHRKIVEKRAPWQSVPGHEKGDGAYVLRRQPDIIILGPAHGSADTAWFLSDVELLENPLFRQQYEQVQVQLPVNRPKLNSGVVFRQEELEDSMTFTYFRKIGGR